MLRLIGCVTEQHDDWLVGVAVLVCLLACVTAMNLTARAFTAGGRTRAAWIAGASAAFGGGVWATHFIAMLAFRPGLPFGFAVPLTAVSLVLPVLGAALAISVQAYGTPRLGARLAAGLIFGTSVSAMHFAGMAAMRVPAEVVFDPPTVLAALAVGVLCATLAVLARARGGRLMPVVLMALAVCGMHFTAMSAVTLLPRMAAPLPAGTLTPGPLALGIAVVAVLILSLGLTAGIVDARHARLLGSEAERLRRLLDATFEGILFHRDGGITEVNARLCLMLGHDRAALLGRNVADVLGTDVPSEPGPDGRPVPVEGQVRGADGRTYPVELLARKLTEAGRGESVVAVRDLSEQKRAQQRIQHLAHHDPVTGLVNRVQFAEIAARALAQAERARRGVALLSLDLDGFKAVNDQLGHQGGDRLLAAVAGRLTEMTRRMDTVARLGGDEFAILQPLADQPQSAASLAERVARLLAQPFDIDGQRIGIGASIGIAMYPGDALAFDDLLRHADLALYRAKAEGRGMVRFFEPGVDERIKQRRQLEAELRHALANGGLELHYQGQFDTAGLELIGYEALLRWDHPRLGRVSPAVFVPIAESSGMIRQLGHWVLEAACQEAAGWPAHLRLCVNLSPAQFRWRDLSRRVLDTLDQTGLAPERLELEITEGVLMDDTDRAVAILRDLKARGVRIALDDFGTGFSSLSYLRRFRFDTLKIDKSFVSAIGEDAEADAIIRAVIALGHSLNLDVIAEGVETPAQLAHLRALDCQLVQGFLLARPLPPAALPHLLAEEAMRA